MNSFSMNLKMVRKVAYIEFDYWSGDEFVKGRVALVNALQMAHQMEQFSHRIHEIARKFDLNRKFGKFSKPTPRRKH